MAKFEKRYEKLTTIDTIKKDKHIVRIRVGESALDIIQLLKNVPHNAVLISANELKGYGKIVFAEDKLVKCRVQENK